MTLKAQCPKILREELKGFKANYSQGGLPEHKFGADIRVSWIGSRRGDHSISALAFGGTEHLDVVQTSLFN
jgi:hypothetical protein